MVSSGTDVTTSPRGSHNTSTQYELATIYHDCNRLRGEMGRPIVDDGEGIIQENLLSPSSRAAIRRRLDQDQAEQIDPALLEPIVEIREF